MKIYLIIEMRSYEVQAGPKQTAVEDNNELLIFYPPPPKW